MLMKTSLTGELQLVTVASTGVGGFPVDISFTTTLPTIAAPSTNRDFFSGQLCGKRMALSFTKSTSLTSRLILQLMRTPLTLLTALAREVTEVLLTSCTSWRGRRINGLVQRGEQVCTLVDWEVSCDRNPIRKAEF